MEISKRPESKPSSGVDPGSLEKTKKAKEQISNALQLPSSPGKARTLQDVLSRLRETPLKALPDLMAQISETALQTGHLYFSSNEKVENWEILRQALLSQKTPSESFLEKAARKVASEQKTTALEPPEKQMEKTRMQIAARAEKMMQRIQSGREVAEHE